MSLQRLTDFVLRSRYHAMLAAFVFDALVIWTQPANSLLYSLLALVFSTIGIAIVGLVTLRRGALDGLLVLVAATLPYYLGYLFYPEEYSDQLVLVGALLVQISNVLTWAIAFVLYRTASWSVVVEVLSAICILGILVIQVLFPNMQAWWGIQLQQYVAAAMKEANVTDATVLTGGADLTSSLVQMQLYATRVAVGFVWINTVIQLMISRWWQEKVFNPGGMRRELHHIRLSQTAGIVFVIGLVLSFSGKPIIVDMVSVLYLAFGFAGFSLLHDYAASLKSKRGLLLFVVYCLLPITIVLIPMLGLLDVWLDFRNKFHKLNLNFK